MKKKLMTGICIFLAVIILGSFLYVGIGKNTIKNKMRDYLKQNNYSDSYH